MNRQDVFIEQSLELINEFKGLQRINEINKNSIVEFLVAIQTVKNNMNFRPNYPYDFPLAPGSKAIFLSPYKIEYIDDIYNYEVIIQNDTILINNKNSEAEAEQHDIPPHEEHEEEEAEQHDIPHEEEAEAEEHDIPEHEAVETAEDYIIPIISIAVVLLSIGIIFVIRE